MLVSSSRLATRNEQLYLLSVHSSSLANSIACTVRAFFFTIRGRVFGADVVVSLSIGLTAALSICFLPTTALLILLRDCILLDICLFASSWSDSGSEKEGLRVPDKDHESIRFSRSNEGKHTLWKVIRYWSMGICGLNRSCIRRRIYSAFSLVRI